MSAQRWGQWRHDARTGHLVFKTNGIEYDVQTAQVASADGLERWQRHLSGKRWATPSVLEDFTRAARDLWRRG